MAKLAKKVKTGQGLKSGIVNPNAAGVDISATELQVCVPVGRATPNNRVFGVYTQDLHMISEWLSECGVTTVAMESTGIYWLPPFRVLKGDGFDVLLVNARDAKNYPGKKTDEADAEWLMLLYSYGLLKPCYQPDNMSRQLRNLCRHRESLVMSSSREVLHLQKSMEQMNLKLDNVFSDILGKSGRRVIEAILSGERDAERLANLADRRCKKGKDEIMLSLEATWDEDHLFIMRQSHDLYPYYQKLIEECDREMEALLSQYVIQVDAGDAEFVKSTKQKLQRHSVGMDIERYAYDLWGGKCDEPAGDKPCLAYEAGRRTRSGLYPQIHGREAFCKLGEPRSEQQDIRREAAVKQGAEKAEPCRHRFQAMRQRIKVVKGAAGRLLQAHKGTERPSSGHGGNG